MKGFHKLCSAIGCLGLLFFGSCRDYQQMQNTPKSPFYRDINSFTLRCQGPTKVYVTNVKCGEFNFDFGVVTSGATCMTDGLDCADKISIEWCKELDEARAITELDPQSFTGFDKPDRQEVELTYHGDAVWTGAFR